MRTDINSWIEKLNREEIKYAKTYLKKHSLPHRHDQLDIGPIVSLNSPPSLSSLAREINLLNDSESGKLLVTKLQTAVRQYRARTNKKTKSIKIYTESFETLFDISKDRNEPISATLEHLINNYDKALRYFREKESLLSKLQRAEKKLSELEKLNSEERLDKLMKLYEQQQMMLSAWEINYGTEKPPKIADQNHLEKHANKNIKQVKQLLHIMKLRRSLET
jgi:hypothetical protein